MALVQKQRFEKLITISPLGRDESAMVEQYRHWLLRYGSRRRWSLVDAGIGQRSAGRGSGSDTKPARQGGCGRELIGIPCSVR